MMRESDLVELIQGCVRTRTPGVEVALGDDCAVLAPSSIKQIVTVDRLVSGVHFDWAYFLPEEVGHKALAVNLSDIAAMGGVPRYALLSLGFPKDVDPEQIRAFFAGVERLATPCGVTVVGGNLSRSPSWI